VLYAGLVLFVVLALLTARSAWSAWHARSGEAKAEAVFDLVAQRMPLRPTEAPGALAWLQRELSRYERHLPDEARARAYRSLATAADDVPESLSGVLAALRSSALTRPADDLGRAPSAPIDDASPSLRRQHLVEYHGRTLALTRSRLADAEPPGADTSSNRFLRSTVPVLIAAQAAIDLSIAGAALPAVPGSAPPRPVRVYAVSEDGTLVSAPWTEGVGDARAADRELTLLSARPGVPTFAPEEFFFRFNVNGADGSTDASSYSGFYLDLGGRGLVSTLMLPIAVDGGGRGVLALDLAFDIDWRAFAASVDPPVVGAAVRASDAGRASWATLASALGAQGAPALAQAARVLADREGLEGKAGSGPLRHGVIDALGAVTAFQVSDATWLLMFFPKTSPAFPMAAVALLAGMLALLFSGFEINRRRADDERQRAERAMAEKQNLLNTMQVPLVVVDPNTDVIVSSNRAAEMIGIRAGTRFVDLVSEDGRAREHYQQMQVASTEPRRAYGVPMRVVDEHGRPVERYAVVRSVAVTAPIDALAADERHRLGVLFLLEPDADLAILSDEIEGEARRDERRRLSGILSHGVDTLARVLEHCLRERDADAPMREFTAWLADYLERRLTVTTWLLDQWDAVPPLPGQIVVDAEQARATLSRFDSVFELIAGDRALRERLHWENGTLSTPTPDRRRLDVDIDWPATFECACPVRGGFGLFLGEVLVNAVRHGRPGTVPRVTITADRVRRELAFKVDNAIDPAAPLRMPRGEAYGGLAILAAMARLFDWHDANFSPTTPDMFVAEWRVPAIDRGVAGQAD
jgi:PAS domain-containing protein